VVSNRQELVLKRVIGLPGDKVRTVNGWVYLNGKRLKRQPAEVSGEGCEGFPEGQAVVERLPGKRSYRVWVVLDAEIPPRDWTVGPNEVFVLGDNRLHSGDSRAFEIEREDIVGKAVLRWGPATCANPNPSLRPD
jgi:signal peptidase I